MLDTGRRSGATRASDGDGQRLANDRLWERGDLVTAYANRVLRPVEVLLLIRYREALSGEVLELGCGAGRVTGYLIEVAKAVRGIDLAPSMVAYCRSRYPRGTFCVGDLREASSFEAGPFDVIVAPCNVLDILGEAEREIALDAIHRALSVGGLLIMSSHNRGFAPRRGVRAALRHLGPLSYVATAIRLPLWLRNRRRLRGFERKEPGYAILNDSAHDFSALHYYIPRDAQARQLAVHGFALIECLDLDGRAVGAGGEAAACPELHYVARRMADVPAPPDPEVGDGALVLATTDA